MATRKNKVAAKRDLDTRKAPSSLLPASKRVTPEGLYDILYEIMDGYSGGAISIRIIRNGMNGQVIMTQYDSCQLLAAELSKKLG